jgi:hypothetical protein
MTRIRIATLAIMLVVIGAGVAYADGSAVTIPPMDAGPAVTAPVASTVPPAIATPDADPSGFLRLLVDAATSGKWKVLAGLVLMGLVFITRRWIAPRVKWFQSRSGGVALGVALSLLATFGLALAASVPLTLSLTLSALSTAVTAAGLWTWLQHLLSPKAA